MTGVLVGEVWSCEISPFRVPTRLLRLINKWLEIEIIDDGGRKTKPAKGIAQGLVIAPLLSNLYLHDVFHLRGQDWWQKRASGDVIITRFADAIVLGFQFRHEATRFLGEFAERFGTFGLTLHPVKTRLIAFGRFAEKPETFAFWGRYWFRAFRWRSQRHRPTWSRFRSLAKGWSSKPWIVHPYPNRRFDARHPR